MFIKIVALQILQKWLLQTNNRSKLLTNICKGYRIYVIWRNISVNTCTRVNSVTLCTYDVYSNRCFSYFYLCQNSGYCIDTELYFTHISCYKNQGIVCVYLLLTKHFGGKWSQENYMFFCSVKYFEKLSLITV